MSKGNRERLLDNRVNSEIHVKEYLENDTNEKSDLSLDSIRNLIHKQNPDYSKAMDLAEELRDKNCGIKWVRKDNDGGTKTLIRDARERNLKAPFDAKESYLIQAINVVQAAAKILEHSGIDKQKRELAQADLNRNLEAVIRRLESGKEIEIKKFNSAIRQIAKDSGISKEQFNERVNIALNFGSLGKQQYHVATINKVTDKNNNEHTVVELDNMMLGLTEKQKAQYQAISGADPSNNISLKLDGESVDMSWYNGLSEFEKSLLIDCAEDIASGNKALPNQLREQMIGLRNAHQKSTYVVNPVNHKLDLAARVMHSGTISFHGKGDRQEITNENARQLESFAGKGMHVGVSTLISPSNPAEKSIHRQVVEAQKKVGGASTTTPFNDFRRFSKNYDEGFQRTLNLVSERLKGGRYEAIRNFLETGKGERGARNQLEQLRESESDLVPVVLHAVEARSLMDKRVFLFDSNNRNLQLVTQMSLLGTAIEEGKLGDDCSKKYNPMSVACKSGKDRTGLAMTSISNAGIAEKLQTDKVKILGSLISGGHTQFMASVNSGTPGCHGIKKEAKAGFSKIFRDVGKTAHLYQQTSSFNSFKVEKEPLLTRIANAVTAFFSTKPKIQVGNNDRKIFEVEKESKVESLQVKVGKQVRFRSDVKSESIDDVKSEVKNRHAIQIEREKQSSHGSERRI